MSCLELFFENWRELLWFVRVYDEHLKHNTSFAQAPTKKDEKAHAFGDFSASGLPIEEQEIVANDEDINEMRRRKNWIKLNSEKVSPPMKAPIMLKVSESSADFHSKDETHSNKLTSRRTITIPFRFIRCFPPSRTCKKKHLIVNFLCSRINGSRQKIKIVFICMAW